MNFLDQEEQGKVRQLQPRTQALSSTLLAGVKTLAGAGHVNTQILGGKLKSTEGGAVEER